jgi:hypothetical protein
MATSGQAGRCSQNQVLGGGNLRNEQGQRNAASELCTTKQVEMLHYLLTLAGEVLSSPRLQVPFTAFACPRIAPKHLISSGISS